MNPHEAAARQAAVETWRSLADSLAVSRVTRTHCPRRCGIADGDAKVREHKESTRKARAAKWAELDAWWGEERRRRAVRARVARGLRALGRTRGQERKRLRDAMADAVQW